MVKEKVESCLPCQAATTGKAERLKPRKMATPPSALWKELAMDFLGLPSEEYLKRIQPFPRSWNCHTTSDRSTIPKLDAIFDRQRIPDVLKSGNGPRFNDGECKNFAEHLGFQHRKITAPWPRANGEAECFMTTLEKCMSFATVENKNRKQELYKFLWQYQATPHLNSDFSPCEALNQTKPKTTLPEWHHQLANDALQRDRRTWQIGTLSRRLRWRHAQTKS